jgi:hypothetical protein
VEQTKEETLDFWGGGWGGGSGSGRGLCVRFVCE